MSEDEAREVALIIATLKGDELFWRKYFKRNCGDVKAYVPVPMKFMDTTLDSLQRSQQRLVELLPEE